MSIREAGSFNDFQAGAGSVGTTAEVLDGSKDESVYMEVIIKNTHASQNLFVGKANVSSSTGFELGPDEEIKLKVDKPSEIYVVGSGAATTYTWCGY